MPRVHLPNGRVVNFPDNMKPEEIEAAIKQESDPPATPPRPAEPPWYRKGMDDIALASENTLRRKGIEPTETQRRMNRQLMDSVSTGAIGAQGLTVPVSRALQSGAQNLYGGLLKVKDATLERFPTVVDDLLANGRVISQGGRRKTIGDLRQIGSQKQAVLKAADASGATIPREQLRGGLDEVLDNAMASSDVPVKDLNKLAKLERDLIPDELNVLPSRADAIKSKLYSESDRAYRGMKLGTQINETGAKARVAVANRAKNAVESIVPGIDQINARYASTKGQATALREALKREGNTSFIGMRDLIGAGGGAALGGSGGAAAGWALMRLLAQPRTGSMTAIGLDKLSRIPQLDQATRAALMALMNQRSNRDNQ